MAVRSIQLQVTFGASYAAVDPTQIYFSVESVGGVVRIARTNAGVEASEDGSFYTVAEINDTWLPAKIKWDDGGEDGIEAAGRKASASIDTAVLLAAMGSSGGSSNRSIQITDRRVS